MAGNIKGSFTFKGNLPSSLQSFAQKAPIGIRMYCETAAKELEKDAKQKAPWTDRTGQARQRLSAYVTELNPGVCEITLAHGVDYGIFLELAHEKRYASLMPAINRKAPEIMRGFKLLLGG